MFRAFREDAAVGDDRRSPAPAIRSVVGLLHRLSAGEPTGACFSADVRLIDGPFPSLRVVEPTLDGQLAAVEDRYALEAWADSVTLSPDGRVLVTGVVSASLHGPEGGFAEAFAWVFGCDDAGAVVSMSVLAGTALARYLAGFATEDGETGRTPSSSGPDDALARRLTGPPGQAPGDAELLDAHPEAAYLVDSRRTIRHWNPGAEKVSGYTSEDMVGRHCYEGYLRHIDDEGHRLCFGMCPLAHTIRDGQPRSARVYLHHRSGHRVPVTVRTQPVTDAQGRRVGAIELFTDESAGAAPDPERARELEQRLLADAATGLPNRRFLEMAWSGRQNDLHRAGTPLAVAVLRVDGLASVADDHGRDAADAALGMVARTLAANVGTADVVTRNDEEAFALLLQDRTPPELTAALDRLRILVAGASLDLPGGELAVTASLGATFARPDDTLASSLARAEAFADSSAQAGGDRLSTEPVPGP